MEVPSHIVRAVAALLGETLEVVGVVEGQKMIWSLVAISAGWVVEPGQNAALAQVSLPSRRAMEGQAEVSRVAVAVALLVSAVAQRPAVLLQIHRQVLRESLAGSISASAFSHRSAMLTACDNTYIPKLLPANKVRVVDLALLVDVLPRPYDHGLGRRDVYYRGFSGVSVRYPYRERESVRVAAEVDGERAGEVHQQRAGAIRRG